MGIIRILMDHNTLLNFRQTIKNIVNIPNEKIDFMAKLFTKKIDKSRYMFSLRANKVTLLREKSGAFHFDGEASEAGKEIEISIIPNGLKILVSR